MQRIYSPKKSADNKLRANAMLAASMFVSTLALVGCQSTPTAKLTAPVIPNANNTYDTSGQGESKNNALADAMHNANVTCQSGKGESAGLRPVVLTHEVKYIGVLSEQTGALIDKVGKVIGAVAGKQLPSTASKTDYEARMTFKCVK